MLSPVHVRSMLESVARTHLAKLDRLAALETADGITPAEGRASDLTMGWVRRLQASQRMAATVGDDEHRVLAENGLSTDQIEEVSLTLELLRRASRGTFPRQKLKALLEDCGASQGEGDIRQAERIYYRGQAAALLAVDRRWSGNFAEDDQLIGELLSRQQPIPSKTVNETAQEASTRQLQAVDQVVSPQAANAPTATAGDETKETSILKLAERLVEEKAKLGEWNAKTQRQVASVAALFVEMIGDDHVRSLAQSRIAEYRSLLLSLPRTYGKGQNDRKTPLAVWLERAKGMPKEQVGREPGTLNRHLSQLQEVLVYIEACGHKISEFTGVSKLLSKKKRGEPATSEILFRQKTYQPSSDSRPGLALKASKIG